MFSAPSNHVNHSSTVVIYHVPISSNFQRGLHSLWNGARRSVASFRQHSSHMSVCRRLMKEPRSAFVWILMPVAQRQQLSIVNIRLSPSQFSLFPPSKLSSFHLNRYLNSCLQLQTCNSRMSVDLLGWRVRSVSDFSTPVWKQRIE